MRIGDGRSLRPRLTWISYNTATLPPTLAPFAQRPLWSLLDPRQGHLGRTVAVM